MHRMRARLVAMAALLLAVGGTAIAGDLGFSANIGLEITFTPVPPTSFNIGSNLCLGFDFSGFTLWSETGFDLAGFVSQDVAVGVDLGAVEISEEIRFEPYFTWNELSLDLSIVGVEIGTDWILADIGGIQTPTYSMGAVVELSSSIACGFTITSLTGFGAVDLVNLLGGIAAPFSYELLYLFEHLAELCTSPEELDVTIVSGFYFEEELVRIEVDYQGMIASSTTWFDAYGLSTMLFELGYRFDDPCLCFLTTMTLDGGFALTGIEFIVDLKIDVVRFTSHTLFAVPIIPTLIPITFAGQRFAVSFEICSVTVTSETDFDGSFLFDQELIGIEAQIDPVTFVSLTSFDAGGFSKQCVYAAVTFSGAVLYTQAEFDLTGIDLVKFGFLFSL